MVNLIYNNCFQNIKYNRKVINLQKTYGTFSPVNQVNTFSTVDISQFDSTSISVLIKLKKSKQSKSQFKRCQPYKNRFIIKKVLLIVIKTRHH